MSYALPFRAGQSLIELGGGEQPIIRPNLDVRAGPTIDIVADLSKPLPITDAQYDGIYCKYCIEHVSWRLVGGFVKEAYRILKPGGTAVFISPNTKAQMEWALQQDEAAYDKVAQCLFGDLDYAENSHKAALSPSYAMRIFREAGFSDVLIVPHGELGTDMVIEAKKPMSEITPNTWDTKTRKEAYGRDYFDGGKGKYGGYAKEGYWDYPVHHFTFQKIMAYKPTSVLELGCARGYILKKLEDVGVVVKGLEVSEHCYHTRVVEGVVTWDITQMPWPFKDKEFDLCFSAAVLEHIPEQHMDAIAQEIRRVSVRGLHGVDFGEHDDGFDKTHCLFRDVGWWVAKLNDPVNPVIPTGSFAQIVVDKEDLEKGPVVPPPGDGKVKVNVGSFTTMFHYGWKNVDQHPLGDWAKAHGFLYQQHDVRNGMPYAGGSVDMIYACHFLEHLTYDEGANFLRECVRVLAPGGVVRLLLPDAELLMKNYIAGQMDQYNELNDGCAKTSYQSAKLWNLLFSGHSSMYDAASLTAAMAGAGLKDVKQCSFRQSRSKQMLTETLDMFPNLSLIMEGIK